MTRVAFVADNQVDEHSRLAEHDRVMDFVARHAFEAECDLMLHGGDLAERRTTVRERESIRRWIADVVETMDVVIAGGNHEAPGEVIEWHRPEDRVHAYERPEVLHVAGCAVAVLPWPRKTYLLELLGRTVSPEESDAAARECLRDILRGFREQLLAHPGPRILLAHAELSGAKTDPDQPECPGLRLALSREDLVLSGADVVLLGHIHLPQEFEGPDGVPIIYAGSPRRTAYAAGEVIEKGYVFLEFGERGPDGRMPFTWERVPTPASPMVLIDAEWVEQDGEWRMDYATDLWSDGWAQHAEIRYRYRFPADQRDAARLVAEEWACRAHENGAAEVKLDPVPIPTVTARAPEVAEADTLRERLRALWRVRDEMPEEPRLSRLLDRADALAAEVA